MRTIGLLGLAAVALCLATPALSQDPAGGRRTETAPLTPPRPDTAEGLGVHARVQRDVGVTGADASVVLAGRPGLQGGAILRERADAWRRQGEFAHAIVEYTRALEASPRDPDSLYGRGWSYHRAGNVARAIDDYTAAAGLRPGWSDVYRMRARAHLAEGKVALAIADLRRAVEYDPKDVDHLAALGLLRLCLGESDVARGNLSRALQFKDDPESMLLLYIARARGGRRMPEELEANARRLRSKAWPFPVVELYLGKRSVSDALAAARTDEERCEAQYYVGQFHLVRGSKPEALAAFEHAARVCPKTNLEYGAAAAELKRLRW